MPQDSQRTPQLVKGLIVKDSKLVAALVFLVIIFGATPTGALAVHAWWTGQLFFGMNVVWYGALLGFVGIVVGLYSVASLINTFLQKNYLIIGEDCFQQIQYGKVIVQIPFDNISRLEYGEHSILGKSIDFSFRDKDDPRTICADWLRHSAMDFDFQIAEAGWQLPMEELHEKLEARLAERLDRGRLSTLRGNSFSSTPFR
jgi:hypothetical protein